MTSRRNRYGRLALTLALFGAMFVGGTTSASAITPPGGGTCSLRDCITTWANYEFSNADGHKYEKGGYNCNYFTKQWPQPGVASCNNAWLSEEWCMDFARWVYAQSGASTAGLDHTAASARNYPGGLHAGAHRGDLALWNPANESHVGIVVDTSGGSVTVISGNSYDPNSPNNYDAIWKSTYPVSTFAGFAEPTS